MQRPGVVLLTLRHDGAVNPFLTRETLQEIHFVSFSAIAEMAS
jgi:hypothetical protein